MASDTPRADAAGDDRPLLRAEHIVKRFPGVVALKDVSFDLRLGEIHALCGENGAGKSTLIKVLSGIHRHGSYDGELWLEDRPLQMNNVASAEANGIAVIYQELALVGEMTVAENIFLGHEPIRGGLIDWLTVLTQSRDLLQRFGLTIDPMARVNSLGVGHQQLVEIVKALGKQSRILILDEPTAALSDQEVQMLLAILRDLRTRGISCIYISHKLDEVFAIADRITVLRDGQSIITLDTGETDRGTVIRHMVGRAITDLFPRRAPQPGEVRLRVRDLDAAAPHQDAPFLKGISFEVRAGEVLGIGGLMGAGRTELLMHLFGAWGHRMSGVVELDGRPLDHPTPQRCIEAGLVLVSEDRKRYGLILEQSISSNLSLSSLGAVISAGHIDPNREFQRNRGMFASLRIKAPNLEAPVGKLSGGNQQKVVLGKALLTEPEVIFLDEPTRGIDVGAKLEVYQLINDLTAQGQAVVLVSSELPELLGMSDRILMLREGAVGALIDRADATQERLLAAAMGHPF